MSKVLVTGANGFLGSWVVRRLLQDGHHVYSLVRKTSDLSELEGVETKYLYGDVTDLHSLLEAFKGMDAVFHLAGLIAYKKSDRAMMEKVNVQGTQNVIEACRAANVPRMVHLSSVVAVGAGYTADQILTEDSPYNISELNLGYFETKRKAELLVIEAVKKNRLNAVILNPSTIYGPGDARKGSRKTQLKVAQGKFKYYTSGGVNVVAVEDCVDGIISAWKKGRTGERYILAGENIRIKELFELIAKEAGQSPPTKLLPNWVLHTIGMVGDLMGSLGMRSPISRENAWTSTMFHWFDSSKAQRELDFKPRPAQIAIAQSVKWIKENGLLQNSKK
jgi:dihydroflavonol-4-reductase